MAGPGEHTVRLAGTLRRVGEYVYLPFDVPAGTNRVHVRLDAPADVAVGTGLFDERGPGYQSAGFRGVYGEERRECFVAAHEASRSFIPGPIGAGTWTVLLAPFRLGGPVDVTVVVTLTAGPEQPAFRIGPTQGVVRAEPGWYRGDLHCHTPESSDAWVTGSALTPQGWARTCREIVRSASTSSPSRTTTS